MVQEVENNAIKTEDTEVAKSVEVEIEQKNPQEENWKKFREAREQERKQREAAERRAQEKDAEAQALKAALEAVVNKPTQQGNYATYDEEETEDQKIQKKVDAALAARDQQLQAERVRAEQQALPERLVQNYSDFNQVCTTDNLDYLEYHYPEVARAFKYAPDNFDKWSDVYKAIKRFVPNVNSKKDEKKAEKNFQKPQSMAVPGTTQVGDTAPINLDDKRRADNWARMQRVMKGGR
jgi:uncharacterized membrane protein YqiK